MILDSPGSSDTALVACALALAEANALSSEEVSTWIDDQVSVRSTPPTWLLDASLARTPEDKLHYLRVAPGVEGASSDPLLSLQASVLAYRRGRVSVEDLAIQALYAAWDHRFPANLKDAVYELDEDANCAHAFNGHPQPERVAKSVALLESRLAFQ